MYNIDSRIVLDEFLRQGHDVLTTSDLIIGSEFSVVEITPSTFHDDLMYDKISKPNTVLLFREFDKVEKLQQVAILNLLIDRGNESITLRFDTRLVVVCDDTDHIANPIKNKMLIL